MAELPEKNMGSYFTPCSMLRLYTDRVPELLKLDRVLYLDYDVVCRGNLTEFYNTDLEGVEAAGVLDIYGKHFYRYHGIWKKRKVLADDL
jgi:lipopolysaccharide biosynthesis glycosyltransferase